MALYILFLHWTCLRVPYNQSQGPFIPSVHSSFHKYYHNRISGHKYQPGIKWRSHLDYNACIVHNDYLNTSPMDYWSNWFTAAVCRGFKQEGIEHAPLNLGSQLASFNLPNCQILLRTLCSRYHSMTTAKMIWRIKDITYINKD